MDGRSLAPVAHSCGHVTFGLTLALSWRTGLGRISAPFRRRFRDSFWSSFGAPKVSWKVARRYTKSQKIRIPTWKASVARFSGWFFLELWNLVRLGTGSGPGGGGQTSLKLMDGRSLVPLRQACTHVTFGLTLAPFWGSGLGLISGPFRRRFRDSFWS